MCRAPASVDRPEEQRGWSARATFTWRRPCHHHHVSTLDALVRLGVPYMTPTTPPPPSRLAKEVNGLSLKMPALEKKVESSALGSGTEVVNRLVSMGMARMADVKVGRLHLSWT
jgi:hypothetical protein